MENNKLSFWQKLLIIGAILVGFYLLGGNQIIDPIFNPALAQKHEEERKQKEAFKKAKIDEKVQEILKYRRKHQEYYDAVQEKNDIEDYIKDYEKNNFNSNDDIDQNDFLP